ncbi:hypothetical protein [Rhizobium tubonense]|uniref:Uncharacterized protein n=1 Tax=Rhizobium tubonense TaxID=484088 RepID=A0A2W4CBR6_9HYPH|nr:hypothetical protein [Rhizobium tubonense]PZM10722.1 hypothetical protein CPY51_22010 [Rhizobium tubonense]
MKYFTVEIGGRPIACFRSEDQEDAEHFFEAEDFREDLTVMLSDGKPLWDGLATLNLRDATAEEQREVDQAYEFDEDLPKEADDEFVVFLVPVSDPADDTDDEE